MAKETYDKEKWLEKNKLQKEEANASIEQIISSYQRDPKLYAQALQFGSNFYNYSLHNKCLIQAQNPYAAYVQSFTEWKKQGVKINKGAKGIKIFVPTVTTLYNLDGKWIKKSDATKEQLKLVADNKVEVYKKTTYMLGNVFDIGQTDFPVERYPEYYHMGYKSEVHSQVVKGIEEFCKEVLACEVQKQDVESIRLRGYFTPADNSITMNGKLNDTQYLSTLIHEMGHAVLHKDKAQGSTNQIELEADSFAIMVEKSCGIELTESRIRHIANHFNEFMEGKESATAKEELEKVMKNVYSKYALHIEDIQKHIETHLDLEQYPFIDSRDFIRNEELLETKNKVKAM